MLVGALVALAVFGVIMVGSASISMAERQTGEPLFYLLRHVGAIGIGCIAMILVAMVPTDLWYRLNWVLLVVGLGLLVIVLVPTLGNTVNGATRWLKLGPITVQASEPARLCLLLYLASYAVRRSQELGRRAGRHEPRRTVRRRGAAARLLARRRRRRRARRIARRLVGVSLGAPHGVPRSVG
jgi:cell division protein FtsW